MSFSRLAGLFYFAHVTASRLGWGYYVIVQGSFALLCGSVAIPPQRSSGRSPDGRSSVFCETYFYTSCVMYQALPRKLNRSDNSTYSTVICFFPHPTQESVVTCYAGRKKNEQSVYRSILNRGRDGVIPGQCPSVGAPTLGAQTSGSLAGSFQRFGGSTGSETLLAKRLQAWIATTVAYGPP